MPKPTRTARTWRAKLHAKLAACLRDEHRRHQVLCDVQCTRHRSRRGERDRHQAHRHGAVARCGGARGRRRHQTLKRLEMFEDPEFWVALAFVIFLGDSRQVRRPEDGALRARLRAATASARRSTRRIACAPRRRTCSRSIRRSATRPRRKPRRSSRTRASRPSASPPRRRARSRSSSRGAPRWPRPRSPQAEAQALADVRAAAADAAVTAAEKILVQSTHGVDRRHPDRQGHQRSQGEAQAELRDAPRAAVIPSSYHNGSWPGLSRPPRSYGTAVPP